MRRRFLDDDEKEERKKKHITKAKQNGNEIERLERKR
jgi:hypothetical protein